MRHEPFLAITDCHRATSIMNHNFHDFILIHPSDAATAQRKESLIQYNLDDEQEEINIVTRFGPDSFASPAPSRSMSSIPSSPPSVCRHRKKLRKSLFTDREGCIEPQFLIPLLDFESQKELDLQDAAARPAAFGFKLRPRTTAFPHWAHTRSPSVTLNNDQSPIVPLDLQYQTSPRSAPDTSYSARQVEGKTQHQVASRRHSLNDSRCHTKMARGKSGTHALAA